MSQHSFGASSRAWATISSSSSGAIRTRRRLAGRLSGLGVRRRGGNGRGRGGGGRRGGGGDRRGIVVVARVLVVLVIADSPHRVAELPQTLADGARRLGQLLGA